jgi:TPR repeat protein
MYEEGLYVEKDLEKAKHWYLCAANQGHKLAMKKIVDKL